MSLIRRRTTHGGGRWFAALGCVAALAATAAGPASATPETSGPAPAGSSASKATAMYVVQMTEPPVVAYTGDVAGLAATAPAKGSKVDPFSADVTKYVTYLNNRHTTVLRASNGVKAYDYDYSFNGFAAYMTAADAAALRKRSDVAGVSADEIRKIDTSTTPAFLGLSAPGGLWEQLGGVSKAGEGVVVGIVDSGIWPESASFSDRDADGKLVYQQIPGYHGKCTPGEQFPASLCNQKLTTAQWFGAGFGGKAGVKQAFPYEYWSARGAGAHGTHTASTAAGNNGVHAIVDGNDLGAISGMAPHAQIAAYKVCWGFDSDPAAGCATSDSVAAIDQATADGVDVINFSISGSTTSNLDPVEVAFFFAARAGVFVAASAGNSGPTASTVAHNDPWVTTVAAGTHDRQFAATVTLGNGATYTGVGLGAAVPSSSVISSTDAGAAGANATKVRLCYSAADNDGIPVLDPAKVAGKIVICDRGTIARINKSAAVKAAGGVGMILTNTSANSLNADFHFVPTVHVDQVAGAAIKAYVASDPSGATASLGQGVRIPAVAPDVAAFSSRGPALAAGGDLLKPDIMAPGVDILAAVSPVDGGRDFDFLSGTSMSSPHIAGIAALIIQKHRDWSPAAVKSALMTSASQTRNDGSNIAGGPFAIGAGQVTPNSAVDPGLVFDSGARDWIAFLCGSGQLAGGSCPATPVDPSDMNYASIAVASLAGTQTVHRTVTNVGSASATYMVASTVPGFNVVISPTSFTLAPGAAQAVNITFTTTTAPFGTYATGDVVFSGGPHTVRMPVVLKPVAIAAPGEVAAVSTGTSFDVQFGYNGPFSATASGLVGAAKSTGTVNDDPNNSFVPGGPGTVAIPVTIPAGTRLARFQLFDADVLAGSDLDLYVYRGTTLVGGSGGGTAAEQVDLTNPTAAVYTVYVHGWQTFGGSPSPFTLYSWLVGATDAGNMVVTAPGAATLGTTGTVSLAFNSLAAGTKYLGLVNYWSGATSIGRTIVRVTG